MPIKMNLERLSENTYYVPPKKQQYEDDCDNNSHYLRKQGLITDAKVTAHKLYNDIFTYFPKGFKGSKNSDFYEFLSLGIVPYLIGSATMIATYCSATHLFNRADAAYAKKAGSMAAAGVVLYGLNKVISKKISRALIKKSTDVNLNAKYLNKIYEIPEPGQEKGLVRTQYSGVLDSAQFPRTVDLGKKEAILAHDDPNYFNDKIVRKAGYRDKLNAPEQIADVKQREIKVRSTALENILGYVPAAFGVALGAQKSFGELGANFHKAINLKFSKNTPLVDIKQLKGNIKNPAVALVDSFKELWNGNSRNFLTKNFGKALIVGTVLTTVLNWVIPTIGFKTNPNTMKSKIDTNKEYEAC